ncbi:MAG: YicC/YloC family endoribonuclease, partial [Planctomycetaceae bacterium]
FLKVSVRTSDVLLGLDQRIERSVQERIRRGSVNVSVSVGGAAESARRRLDQDQLAAYFGDLRDFCAACEIPTPDRVDALMTLPGVVREIGIDDTDNRHWPLVEETLQAALEQMDRMRRAEGSAMAADLCRTCDDISGLVERIRQRIPEVVENQHRRLRERIAKLLIDQSSILQPADVAREVAILADRADVAEEIVRLESHLTQFRELVAMESTGRQLDFLSQELAREANTIASKSADVAIAHAVVEIKSRLERLREVVQNLE